MIEWTEGGFSFFIQFRQQYASSMDDCSGHDDIKLNENVMSSLED